MKKFILSSIIGMIAMTAAFAQSDPQLRPDNIDEVVNAMTLEEKASMVNGIGTFWDSVRTLRDPLGAPGGSYEIERLGVPALFFGDGPYGIRMSRLRPYDSHLYSATAFPSPLLTGSSWDDELLYEMGLQMGEECRELGIDVLLAPALNIQRNPLNGRTQEYYSEDPLVSGKLAAAMTRGLQDAGVGATPKHFAANNQETSRGSNNARMTQRTLREIYLKAFEICVKEGHPWALMTSYNGINGEWTAQNEELLEGILRGEWGFDGAVMTDWGGGNDAVKRQVAGNDMAQAGGPRAVDELVKAVREGRLDEAILDRNVKRILGLVVKTWSYKKYPFTNNAPVEKGAELARRAGAESAVLVKNEGNALPLKAGSKVAVYGQTSYNIIPGGIGYKGKDVGNYIITLIEGLRLAGLEPDFGLVQRYPLAPTAPQTKAATRNIPTEHEEIMFTAEELAEQASANESALMVLGHRAGEGTDRTVDEYYFNDKEKQLMKDVADAYHAAGKRLTVILNTPGPVEVESWKDIPDAILIAYVGGEQIGNWMADLLSGRVTPSGKLAVTWAKDIYDYPSANNFPYRKQNNEVSGMMAGFTPGAPREAPRMKTEADGVKDKDYTNYEEGVYVGYRYFDSFGKEVSFPFGYGLSYTSFEYGNATLENEGGVIVVKVPVKNTGNYVGREIVQLYVSAPDGKIEKPVKELRAYGKTRSLYPGETQVVELRVKEQDLASFNDKKSRWETEAGTYQFHVAASSVDVRQTLQGKVKASFRPVGNLVAPDGKINEISRKKK